MRRPSRHNLHLDDEETEEERDPYARWWKTRKAYKTFLALLCVTMVLIFVLPTPQLPSEFPEPPEKVKPVPEGFFRVAALQFVSNWGDPERNRTGLERLIRTAAAQQAKIVVMPEAAIPGYLPWNLQPAWRDPGRRSNPLDGVSLEEAGVAETVPGTSSAYFGKLAKELGIYLVVSLIERVAHSRDPEATRPEAKRAAPPFDYFNTALLLNPQGAIVCHYRKLNPWPPGEATWAQPGNRGIGLVETEFGKLGLLICYDLTSRVPETLIEAGATTLLYPIGWVCDNPGEWFGQILPEKVKGWGINLVGANWSLFAPPDDQHQWLGFGYSSIIRKDGLIIDTVGAFHNQVLIGDLPLP